MDIKRNFSLSQYNSFGVDHNAKYFVEIENLDQIENFLNDNNFKKLEKLILGGGSNILFTKDFEGIILLNKISGIKKLKEDKNNITLRVGSGENWDNFVSYCVKNEYYGIENLSLIPGSVGAAPIQNIGAYGVEIKTFIESVNGLFLESVKEKKFDNKSCLFEYRNSIFKNQLKNKFFITSVDFKLNKRGNFNLSYKDLNNLNKESLTLSLLRKKIIDIRNSKLPNPEEIGNAGSFFKNPLVDKYSIDKIRKTFDDLIFFTDNGKYKIPAAWLIEKCGWKGFEEGNIGVSKKHALVIVNYGEKDGNKIDTLSNKIIKDVKEKFNIVLEPEVNIF